MTIAVNRNLSNCEYSPKKIFSGLLRDPVEVPKIFLSGYIRNCLNCDSLRWSHTHFIFFFLQGLRPPHSSRFCFFAINPPGSGNDSSRSNTILSPEFEYSLNFISSLFPGLPPIQKGKALGTRLFFDRLFADQHCNQKIKKKTFNEMPLSQSFSQ